MIFGTIVLDSVYFQVSIVSGLTDRIKEVIYLLNAFGGGYMQKKIIKMYHQHDSELIYTSIKEERRRIQFCINFSW